MKSVTLSPSKLKGTIQIPPSKSIAHRAIICAGLARGESSIDNVQFSQDILATLEGMKAFGISINSQENKVIMKENHFFDKEFVNVTTIDCHESGSTLRFLIPLAMVRGKKVTFQGRGKLVTRPLDPYYKIFKEQKISYCNDNGSLPLTIDGKLQPGEFHIAGNISSQFITGLLFALPLLPGESKIIMTTELESKGYVDLTLDLLNKFGIQISNQQYREFIIQGNQNYKSNNYTIEGDFSQAAFWLAAAFLGSDVVCENLNRESLQGDKVVINLLKKFGTEVNRGIDASECPDLVPILAVVAALSPGNTRIYNAARVRIKECDRLTAITSELKKLGADIEEFSDGLEINGKEQLQGRVVESWNDHRIAMALAIAATKCEGSVVIQDSECVRKSYPSFWEDFKALGGCVHERNMG